MSKTLKRQLNDSEKERILEQYGRRCFATNHEIPENESVEFDHLRAFASGGESELNNIAPMCNTHNQEKGQLSLYDFRAKLELNDFFKKGDRLTLRDLLVYLQSKGSFSQFGLPVSIQDDGDRITVESPHDSQKFRIYQCPITRWKYFYATLSVNLIDSDDDHDQSIGLQPRYLIFDKVFELFRHFQRHPVLQPSLGRLVNDRIRLFDGQHKAAAILWNKRQEIECKIYLAPDMRLLNQTNISAHEKFAQTRFFSSIMVSKLGSQFKGDFEAYRDMEDGSPKSEKGFVDYLRSKDTLTRFEVNKRFRSYLHNSILEDEGNLFANFVSAGNRRTKDKPLTMDMLSKSLFSNFVNQTPVSENMATDAYLRDMEIKNMVTLMNMFVDLALHQWDLKADSHSGIQKKLERVFGSKSMMSWSEILKDAICGKLDIHDSDEKVRPFYREFDEQQINQIKSVVTRLVDWKRWDSPVNDDIDKVLSDNKSRVKEWMKKQGLTTGYLMGAPE